MGEGVYLIDVRDELPLPGHVDLLIVGPHLALNREKQHFQVPLLREPKHGKNHGKRYLLYSVQVKGKY